MYPLQFEQEISLHLYIHYSINKGSLYICMSIKLSTMDLYIYKSMTVSRRDIFTLHANYNFSKGYLYIKCLLQLRLGISPSTLSIKVQGIYLHLHVHYSFNKAFRYIYTSIRVSTRDLFTSICPLQIEQEISLHLFILHIHFTFNKDSLHL